MGLWLFLKNGQVEMSELDTGFYIYSIGQAMLAHGYFHKFAPINHAGIQDEKIYLRPK